MQITEALSSHKMATMSEFQHKEISVIYKNDQYKHKSATSKWHTDTIVWSAQPTSTFLQAFFPLMLQTSFSETLNYNDGSGEPLLFSYLHFSLPSSFSNTQGCQLAKTDSPRHPPSAVSFFIIQQQQNACCPHHENGIHIFLHWDLQPIDCDHFSEAPTFYPSYSR